MASGGAVPKPFLKCARVEKMKIKNATDRTPHHEGPEDIDWRRARVVGRGLKTGRRHGLSTLRIALGKTQAEIAEHSGMRQGDVSRLEGRGDVKISTLERYAKALGGAVELAVVLGGRRYLIALDE